MLSKDFFKFFECIEVRQFHHQNQYEIFVTWNDGKYVIFQSYNTVIAVYSYDECKMYLSRDMWDYSRTTLRHLYLFIKIYTYYMPHSKSDIMDLLREKKLHFYN